jgi:PEP-CTERM motif
MVFSVVFRSDPMKTFFLTALSCCALSVSAIASPLAYAGAGGGQFGILDLGTGGFSQIGVGPGALIGLGSSNGTLYGLDSSGELLMINAATAAFVPVGATGLLANVFTSLTSGGLFAVDNNWNLYSINPTTAVATSIGPIKVGGNPLPPRNGYADSLAADANSLYFTLDLWTTTPGDVLASKLYRVDPATGSATVLGLTGQEDLSGSVLIGGTLYAFTGNFAGSPHKIFTLNTSTGAATFSVNVPSAPASLYGATVATINSVPEPGTFAIAGLALLGLWARRSWLSREALRSKR